MVIVRAADVRAPALASGSCGRTFEHSPLYSVIHTIREKKTSRLALETGKGARHQKPDSGRTEPRRHCHRKRSRNVGTVMVAGSGLTVYTGASLFTPRVVKSSSDISIDLRNQERTSSAGAELRGSSNSALRFFFVKS
jgi:hypothetical protein